MAFAFAEQYGRLFVYLTEKKGGDETVRFRGVWHHDYRPAAFSTAPPIPSMNLVGIKLSTAKVTSSALACEQFPVRR